MTTGISILNKYRHIGKLISEKIASESDAFILGTSDDELVNYYYLNNHYTPVEIDLEATESIEVKKERRIIPAHQRESPFQGEGDLPFNFESIVIRIPLKPNPRIDVIRTLEPSSFSTGYFFEDLIWQAGSIKFEIPIKGYGYNKPDDQVAKEVAQSKEWVYNRLHIINAELLQNNQELLSNIRQWIKQRKQTIEEDNNRYSALLKKIDIPIRKKDDEAVKRIQLDTNPLVQRVRPTPKTPEEYELDRAKVQDIIQILNNQGHQFEKTPNTYDKMGEEDLRNILLVNLNSVFEGKATGETFMNKGKTDIYLNIDKGNILSFECKFWNGKKLYGQTIDQLLGYLTWRMNYGVIVLFSKQVNFSNVLQEGKAAIKEHSTYKNGFHEISNTHFLSHHKLPSDEHKSVEIHHLFYTLRS